MSYRFTAEAMADLAEAVRHYRRLDPELASRLTAEVDAAIDYAEHFPQLGRMFPNGLRKRRVRASPYDLIFRFEDGQVIVAAVHHHRRHPDRWLKRDH